MRLDRFLGFKYRINLTFGSVQLSTAETTGISVALVLALQSVGGAMGNMVCINNIVAVSSVLNISNQEGTIIKKTIIPMIILRYHCRTWRAILSTFYFIIYKIYAKMTALLRSFSYFFSFIFLLSKRFSTH